MTYRQTFMSSVTAHNDRAISATPQPMHIPRMTMIVTSMLSAELARLPGIAAWSLGLAAVWFVIAWFFHQSMINAATGARPVSRREEARVWNLLENLCISRGLTMPRLNIIETDALNAFASGLTEKSYKV